MSVATPTVLPRPQIFPHLLPKAPQPHPTPLPRAGPVYGRFNARRDFVKEMEDLSDEETEIEELNVLIHNRGYNNLIPMGRNLTQQEEKNDADEDEEEDDDSSQAGPVAPPSVADVDEENDSTRDLDATMEDLDAEDGEEGDEGEEDISGDAEDVDELMEGDTEELELLDDGPSI